MYYEDGYDSSGTSSSYSTAGQSGTTSAGFVRALVGGLVMYVCLGALYCIWIYTKTDTDADHDGNVTQEEFEAAIEASKLGRIFGPIATLASSLIKHSDS